jgi:hypothetical protein
VSWLHTAWYVLAALCALTLLIVLMRKRAARLANRMNLGDSLPHSERLKTEAQSFGEGFRQLFTRGHLVQIWGASMLAWTGAFAINYLLMKALRIDAPVTVAVLLTCVTNLAMLIPSSPGYIGVFHVAAVSALVPFNVDRATALSFAIIAHLVNVLPVSILGALFLLAGRDSLRVNFRGLRKGADPLSPSADFAGDGE